MAAADERTQAESLSRVEAGGVPPAALERLGQLGRGGGSFTSDLSSADYALCHQLGLSPLAQVMGSSVYQVGYQGLGYQSSGLGGGAFGRPGESSGGLVGELGTLTHAWNDARERALGRLAEEARAVGADAVIGVSVRADVGRLEDSSMSSGLIEYSLVGTAVRRRAVDGAARATRRSAPAPVLTELSVAEYAKLVSAGFEPVGIAAWSAVFYSFYRFRGAMGAIAAGVGRNFEVREFTQAIYAAREAVMERLGEQARALGASGIVGVRIPHTIRRQSIGQSSEPGLVVTFHAIGTAIGERAGASPAAPKAVLDLLA